MAIDDQQRIRQLEQRLSAAVQREAELHRLMVTHAATSSSLIRLLVEGEVAATQSNPALEDVAALAATVERELAVTVAEKGRIDVGLARNLRERLEEVLDTLARSR